MVGDTPECCQLEGACTTSSQPFLASCPCDSTVLVSLGDIIIAYLTPAWLHFISALRSQGTEAVPAQASGLAAQARSLHVFLMAPVASDLGQAGSYPFPSLHLNFHSEFVEIPV